MNLIPESSSPVVTSSAKEKEEREERERENLNGAWRNNVSSPHPPANRHWRGRRGRRPLIDRTNNGAVFFSISRFFSFLSAKSFVVASKFPKGEVASSMVIGVNWVKNALEGKKSSMHVSKRTIKILPCFPLICREGKKKRNIYSHIYDLRLGLTLPTPEKKGKVWRCHRNQSYVQQEGGRQIRQYLNQRHKVSSGTFPFFF